MMRTLAKSSELDEEQALQCEREARMSAVRLSRAGDLLGFSRADVAEALGLEARTLREWQGRWRRDRLKAATSGRPRSTLSREQRQCALYALNCTRGRIGIQDLMRVVWPPAARSALIDLKSRWRYAAHRRGGRMCASLSWTRAGSVWAMDWTDPDVAIDGIYTKILVVRDLSSHKVLISLACQGESGREVARVLEQLIARCGAPAVIKEDNGHSLRCRSVDLVMAHHGILTLTSPPWCPEYNGACEAGIGSLKVRTRHLAAARGAQAEWTCDDLEAARVWGNARVRENGLSAEDMWSTRRVFSERERDELWQRYRTEFALERKLRGIAPAAVLERMEQASVDRAAIARALEEQGLVRFRRRWIRPPIRSRKVSRKW